MITYLIFLSGILVGMIITLIIFEVVVKLEKHNR